MLNYNGALIDAAKPTYASDGGICGDWRKVKTGGRIKFGGSWWQHEKLLDHVGRWVWCEVTEYWHVATRVMHSRPGMPPKDYFDNFICECR